MTVTPDFTGTHLWDRLCWAKENLEGVQSDYRVVYEDSIMNVQRYSYLTLTGWRVRTGRHPPPVWVYELAKDEAEEGLRSTLVATCCTTPRLLTL